jgi:regulator of nucleoside diphosphate kinase
MESRSNKIVVRKDDFEVMSSYIKGRSSSTGFNGEDAHGLLAELSRATIVDNSVFPKKVVRINSRVLVKEEVGGKLFELTVVTPEKADMKLRKVSFMAPIGVALIGFKEGDKVKWVVPSGEKVFLIVKVNN